MEELKDVFCATLEKWGVEAQYDQAVEECAELITALKHFKRNRVGEERIIEELADVALMVGQLSYMFGSDRVDRAIQAKIVKLRHLLDQD
jgi:NTP pyrophosphatase (non-canonical NTP hydrolase)